MRQTEAVGRPVEPGNVHFGLLDEPIAQQFLTQARNQLQILRVAILLLLFDIFEIDSKAKQDSLLNKHHMQQSRTSFRRAGEDQSMRFIPRFFMTSAQIVPMMSSGPLADKSRKMLAGNFGWDLYMDCSGEH